MRDWTAVAMVAVAQQMKKLRLKAAWTRRSSASQTDLRRIQSRYCGTNLMASLCYTRRQILLGGC